MLEVSLKYSFKNRKNLSKQCANNILLKFFYATLRRGLKMWNKRVPDKIMKNYVFRNCIQFARLNSALLTPWQLFSTFHSTCYSIFGSFAIFNSTFFENLNTISLLNYLM